MKLVILCAFVTLAAAQMPMPLGGGYDVDPLTSTDADVSYPWTNSRYKWTDSIIGRPPGIFDRYPPQLPYNMRLPSYGPYIRYGNRILPYTALSPYTYGNIINQYAPIGPYTPYASMGPYSTYGSGPMISDPLVSAPYSKVSRPVFLNPNIVDPRLTTYGDVISSMERSNDINGINPYSDIGTTPYSPTTLFNLITRGGVGKLDLYSKLILGRSTGLSRKMREVCPEVDGGLSYVSCLTDAHSKTFRCLKGVENHPRFAICTHKPVVKKAMRDWYVHDYNWHKEVVKCLSTTSYTDKTLEKIVGVPQIASETDFDWDSSSSDEEIGGKSNWNVEPSVSTRQCFYKLRKETSKCQEAASMCPKFKKCYIHPMMKTLEMRKHVKQAKFVKLMDSCLAGAIIPDEIVPDDTVVPESLFPEIYF